MRVYDEVQLDLAMYGVAVVQYTDLPSVFKIERKTQDIIPDARDLEVY